MSQPELESARPNVEQRAQVTRRVTWIGVWINVVLTILKILVGILAHSQSLIADGIHSLSDLLSDGVVLYAAHHARQAADAQHPYGHGRFETAATLGLAVLLLLVGAGLVWDAGNRLFSPAMLLRPGVIVLYVALLSVVTKEWLYHYTRRAARRVHSDMMLANAWHHRSDAVSSVVVFIGVAGTMAGLPYLDAVAATIVGLMIAKIGVDLTLGALRELVDTGLDDQRIRTIRDTILAVGGVSNIHMLRTRRLGGVAVADVHVLVEPRLSVSEGHMIGLMVEQRLKQVVDDLGEVTVHIDPEDDEATSTCLELPLRVEALRRIEEAWRPIPEASARTQIVLHYLSGKIEIDVYFPFHDRVSVIHAESLSQELGHALAHHAEFRQVRVYFG